MPWVAKTSFSQIGIGTSLHLEESESTQPPGPFQIGSDMAIEFPSNVSVAVKIVSADSDEMIIEDAS
jgi:hypothetical protein